MIDKRSPGVPPGVRDPTDAFLASRDRIHAIAYRITGSVADADDVAQDAWLRWQRVDHAGVRDPEAFLSRTGARLALDRLRRRKSRAESYVGEWLPEPLPDDEATTHSPAAEDPAEIALRAERVSMGMLVMLETLSPLERAAFVLREAFDLPYADIAEALERTEPAARQLCARARRHVEQRRGRFDTDPETQRVVSERFLAATVAGDLAALMEVLSPGVTLVADGAGKVRAPLRAVVGGDKVARFLLTVAARERDRVTLTTTMLNGAPAIEVRAGGDTIGTLHLESTDGRVTMIWLVAAPDKLGHMSRNDGGAASDR